MTVQYPPTFHLSSVIVVVVVVVIIPVIIIRAYKANELVVSALQSDTSDVAYGGGADALA
jgi:hypothetical protein